MSTLKLVMASSLDGIVSLGPNDDMFWTGESDKKAFRLLTSVGGVLGAGRRTFENLPALRGRTVRCISHSRRRMISAPGAVKPGEVDGDAAFDASYSAHETLTLQEFAQHFPQGWLIGGQTVALEALKAGLVNEVFMCRAPVDFRKDLLSVMTPTFQKDYITPQLRSDDQWGRTDEFNVGDTRIEVWRFK